ncbi:hypothetical protein DFAR_3960004 [Desulfarculales bacterium]
MARVIKPMQALKPYWERARRLMIPSANLAVAAPILYIQLVILSGVYLACFW